MNTFSLLATRRFGALFAAQVASALHDNLFKNALIASLLWGALSHGGIDPGVLVALAGAVFVLPFCLFAALGGQLADKYPRHRITRLIKAADLLVVILGSVALIAHSFPLALVVLFALGTGSALFGPTKMALLPQHLEAKELVTGNALFNTGLFVAILLGTILGALLTKAPFGDLIISGLLLIIAATGYIAARFIPPSPAPDPRLQVKWEPLSATWSALAIVFAKNAKGAEVALAILGVAWFYFAGGVFMTQLPTYTNQTLGDGQEVLVLFLVLFSVGVAVGGLLSARLLGGRVEATFVPLAAIGIAIFTWDLSIAHPSKEEDSLLSFLSQTQHWRIILDLAGIALCGGLFVVPLNAFIQSRAPEDIRARILSVSAIVSALAGVLATLLSAGLLLLGFSVPHLFAALGVMGAVVAVITCALLPAAFVRSILQAFLKTLYRVEIKGMDNLVSAGPGALIVANHVSYLDAALLATFLPGRPMFAVNSAVATWWWVKPWRVLVRFFPLDPGNPFALKALIRAVEGGERCIIFPEGRLTETGALMKIYEGPGMVADRAGVPIVPIRLSGVQYTPFATRLAGRVPRKWFPCITMTILPPRPLTLPDNVTGRARRAAAGLALYDLMEGMMYETWPRPQNLWTALLEAKRLYGAHIPIIEDTARKPLTYGALVQRAVALAQALEKHERDTKAIGLLLPTSGAAVVSFFALQALGRPAAMLNFSAGAASVLAACKAAKVDVVITAKAFVEKARLASLITGLEEGGLRIVYLEDIARRIGPFAKIRAALTLPSRLAQKSMEGDVATILFTSGSEGAPKGVALTHENILCNIVQLSCRVDFTPADVAFCALPTFHAFGLTAGALLPILSGVRTFLYPSPLHYRIVPEMVYSTNATIMFGTDTFLAGYARSANPYDFYRMRYIFAGAEKVRDSTKMDYMNRFGVRVLEGYGATEAAPVIAVNSAMHARPGSVGRLLPGMEWRVDAVQGVEGPRTGRLFVRGDNIMAGYYRVSVPGVLDAPKDDWHDTGDIVRVDEEGYVFILGRAKRFAKVAGEMISLTLAEDLATQAEPLALHAVIALPDEKKGQCLILITTAKTLTRARLVALAAERGITPLAVPAEVRFMDTLPLLPSGKVDYVTLDHTHPS